MSAIFKDAGLFIALSQKNEYSYVTISLLSNSQKTYFGKAPVLGIQIALTSDVSIHKSLLGGFYVTVFPDNPIRITITGLSSIVALLAEESIDAFYNLYKVSKTQSKILIVTVGTVVYKAILTSMQQSSIQDPQFPRIMNYTLALIGKRQN